MTRLTRRNRTKWHRLMKKRGLKWMKGAFWKPYRYELMLAVGCDSSREITAELFREIALNYDGTVEYTDTGKKLLEELGCPIHN
jgi:hypothetical protein